MIRKLGGNIVKINLYSLIPGLVILAAIITLLNVDFFDYTTMATSPSFELQELINDNRQWVQTYGNSSENLKSSYTDILAVNYISDGQGLNTTIWLNSAFSNNSLPYNSDHNLSRKLTYGMLIDADANTKTGYNGADYDLYIENVAGNLNAYLYQLSSTGGFKLMGSETNFTYSREEPQIGPGHMNLNLDLSAINYPNEYNILFYSAESLNSNEVRQFTNWVTIPPPGLQISTSPGDITIRQGEEQLIPARIKSTSGFSNDVINITLGISNDILTSNIGEDIAPSFNSSELHVKIQRNQPPLIQISVPKQTPLGIYNIPLIVTIREPSLATTTKPTFSAPIGGTVDPRFELSKKFPTVGYLTKPVNLTVTVIPPMNINDHFKEFWSTYGQFIGIFAGGFVGAYAKLLFDKAKGRKEKENK